MLLSAEQLMNYNTIAYTYLERLYHEWTNAHTYTQEQLHAAYIPAPLYKGFNQTKGLSWKTNSRKHRNGNECDAQRRTHRAIPPPPHVGETAVDWKDMKVKNEQIAQLCIPWMSCILPLLPVRPGLKPGCINTTPSRAYACVSDWRGPPNTHRQCQTLLLFHSNVWPQTSPQSCLAV